MGCVTPGRPKTRTNHEDVGRRGEQIGEAPAPDRKLDQVPISHRGTHRAAARDPGRRPSGGPGQYPSP
jgi:hypothetical protein